MTRSAARPIAAVVAVFALFALAGCQSRPGTAAFVGHTRFTEDRVQQAVDEGLRDPAVRSAVGSGLAGYRQRILGRLIKQELVNGAAAKLHVSVSQGQVEQLITTESDRLGGRAKLAAALAQDPYNLPPSRMPSFFRELLIERQIGQDMTKDVTFTDAQLKHFYDINGGAQTGQTFKQLKPRVAEVARQQLADQRAQVYIERYLRGIPVKVNPRYGRFDAAKVFDPREPALVVPLGDGLVQDTTPSPAAPQAPAVPQAPQAPPQS